MKILVTNLSSPTFLGTLYSLREQYKCTIIGVSKKETCNSLLIEKYIKLDSSLNEEEYFNKIIEICKSEKPDIFIPQSIKDRILFMKNKQIFDKLRIPILSSSHESISFAENKESFLELCKKINIPHPEFYVVSNYNDLKLTAKKLGYPQKKVVIKPVASSGSKGLRILNKKVNFRKIFDAKRFDHPEITLSYLKNFIGEKFKPLIVSEYLPGKEFTVDAIRQNNFEFYVVRERVEVKNGLTTIGKIVDYPKIVEYCKLISNEIDLTSIFGFQFKEDEFGNPKILECNPRIQGTTYMSTLAGANLIAKSISDYLKLKDVEFNLDYNMKFYRVYSGISIGKETKIINYNKSK